ncbi:MAG: hypothetical protein QM831_02370 [Kofleriaceae bacterium]
MSWFSSDAEKQADQPEAQPQAQPTEGPGFVTEALLEGLVIASGGAAPALAGMLISHKLGRDPAIWVWFQKKFGNQKTKEIQGQVDSQQKQPQADQPPPQTPQPQYTTFIEKFNADFPSVAPQFALKEETVPQYFTGAQIAQLTQFFNDNVVPPNLFHTANQPMLTAQKRILLGGVILSGGKLPAEMNSDNNKSRDGAKDKNGKVTKPTDDRLHAENCGHWASQVYLYAGVNENGYNASAKTYNTDSGGESHVANGVADPSNPFAFTGAKDPNLPLEGKQADAAGKSDKPEAYYRNKEANMDQINQLQPGDWIYIYNANADFSGGHSEIFNGWDGEQTSKTDKSGTEVVYRTAHVMSQRNVGAGGEVHKQYIGPQFSAELNVATLTAVQRVTADSGELTDLNQIVSASTDEQNEKIITDKKLDKQKLHDYLVDKARGDLKAKKNLADSQNQMFTKAIDGATSADTHSISLLVAASQKLEATMGTKFGVIDQSILKDIAKFKAS